MKTKKVNIFTHVYGQCISQLFSCQYLIVSSAIRWFLIFFMCFFPCSVKVFGCPEPCAYVFGICSVFRGLRVQKLSVFHHKIMLKLYFKKCVCLESEFVNVKEPRNRFQGIDYSSLCSLAGRYDKVYCLYESRNCKCKV
jgi:hypothetical protein